VAPPLLIVDIGAESQQSLYDRGIAIAAGLGSEVSLYCPVPRETEPADARSAAELSECEARLAARSSAIERAGIAASSRVDAVASLVDSTLAQIDSVQPGMTIVAGAAVNNGYAAHCQTLNHALISRSTCDIWFVQREFDDRKRVVLATVDIDEKETAARMRDVVLSQARRYAEAFGKDAHILHALSTSAAQDMVSGVLPSGRSSEHLRSIEKEHVERVHQFARRHDYNPEYVHIDVGELVENLKSLIDPMHVDVVVAGTSLRSDLSHLFAGSHVTSLIDSLPCDVWVVRP
jgi:nucleotide-binding universal stress UspA family protein